MISADPVTLAFDVLLAMMIIGLAAMSAFARQQITAIACFIALGLALALGWLRLGAVDVALAELILGAGVLGGLLLRAWSGYAASDPSDGATTSTSGAGSGSAAGVVCVTVVAVAIAGILIVAGHASEPVKPGLAEAFAARIDRTGVSHPVTAILLDFRALDTLMELAVLLVATVTALAVGRTELTPRTPTPALASLLRVIVPLLILTSGVLLWRGAFAPGGAFHAGACLGAAAIAILIGWQRLPLGPAAAHLALAIGVSLFALLGVGTTAFGAALLDWPDAQAGAVILAVEAAASVSIAAGLTLLFAGGAIWPAEERTP